MLNLGLLSVNLELPMPTSLKPLEAFWLLSGMCTFFLNFKMLSIGFLSEFGYFVSNCSGLYCSLYVDLNINYEYDNCSELKPNSSVS